MATRNVTAAVHKVRGSSPQPLDERGLARISARLSMAAGGLGSWTRPWWRWGSRTLLSQVGRAQMAMRLLLIQLLAASRVGHGHHVSCTCHGRCCRVMFMGRWSWTFAPA